MWSTCAASRRNSKPPVSAWKWTSAPSGCRPKFATRSCRRFRTCSWRGDKKPEPADAPFACLAGHGLGLVVISRLAHWPRWSMPLLLGAFCLSLIFLRRWFVQSLAPLVILYSLAGLRLGLVYGLRQSAPLALDYGWALGIS